MGLLTVVKTIIGTNPWVIHRNTEVFGNDVESFRPERWLKTNDRANMGAVSPALYFLHVF